MACPACGCKETYGFYDEEDDFRTVPDPGYERCAACGAIFDIEDHAPEDDDAEIPPADQQHSMTNTTRPAEETHGNGEVRVAGATVYVLNVDGVNRWSAQVQPGFDDGDQRVSYAECQTIAQRIAAALAAPGAAAAAPSQDAALWSAYAEGRKDEADESVCRRCNGSGEQQHLTSHLGPDDYEVTGPCGACSGTGVPTAQQTVNRATVIEWLDALDIEVTDRQLDGLFDAARAAQAQGAVPPSGGAHG